MGHHHGPLLCGGIGIVVCVSAYRVYGRGRCAAGAPHMSQALGGGKGERPLKRKQNVADGKPHGVVGLKKKVNPRQRRWRR